LSSVFTPQATQESNHEAVVTPVDLNSKATIKIFEHYKLYSWVENHTFYNFKELD